MTFTTSDDPAHRWRTLQPGTRVVIRRRLKPTSPPSARWTDLIGFIIKVSNAGLLLLTDPAPGRGEPEEIMIETTDIDVVKPVPPRPLRRSGPPR